MNDQNINPQGQQGQQGQQGGQQPQPVYQHDDNSGGSGFSYQVPTTPPAAPAQAPNPAPATTPQPVAAPVQQPVAAPQPQVQPQAPVTPPPVQPVQQVPAAPTPVAPQPVQPQAATAPAAPAPMPTPTPAPAPVAPQPTAAPVGQAGQVAQPTPPTPPAPPVTDPATTAAGLTSGAQPGDDKKDEEDKTPANYQLGKYIKDVDKVPVPENQLNFDKNLFMTLLAGSISLSKEEKLRIIESIPKLRQQQVDQLIQIFEEEKRKFAELSEKHVPQLEKLAKQHALDWEAIVQKYTSAQAAEHDQAEADKIREQLGL